jgi:hypothetical protein
MAFLRFVVPDIAPDSTVEAGLFQVASELRDSADATEEHRRLLRENLEWFSKHLEEPTRFNRTSSKGHYRRATKGISWFRDTAHEHLARMHKMRQIIEACGRPVTLIREQRVGYVVYEDDVQVVAEPFADTRTNA